MSKIIILSHRRGTGCTFNDKGVPTPGTIVGADAVLGYSIIDAYKGRRRMVDPEDVIDMG